MVKEEKTTTRDKCFHFIFRLTNLCCNPIKKVSHLCRVNKGPEVDK